VELSLARYEGRQGAGGFDRLGLEARHFQPLGSERRVLALRAGATLDAGRGSDIPFYLLDSLGGGERLRGYQAFRFRGPRLWAFTAEYRHELARLVEAVAFYDAGKVWAGNDALSTSGFLGSYGAGLRLKTIDTVLLRLEAARGNEGTRLNVKVGYSF
jgi:outer membrane protein insertion porin family